MKHAYELLAIECINALFWDYTRDDIQTLRGQYKDFDYVWDIYINNKGDEEAFDILWECWMTKLNVATKHGLIEYALDKYGEEKMRALDSANQMSGFWKQMEDGD